MSTAEFFVTSICVCCIHCFSARDYCFSLAKGRLEICMSNSAASLQCLIYFLVLPVKMRLNKDTGLCTREAEALSFIPFSLFLQHRIVYSLAVGRWPQGSLNFFCPSAKIKYRCSSVIKSMYSNCCSLL